MFCFFIRDLPWERTAAGPCHWRRQIERVTNTKIFPAADLVATDRHGSGRVGPPLRSVHRARAERTVTPKGPV